jgi:3-oxoadipate enol-lactonase
MWHEETGSGPPVVLVHAGIADSRMWDREWRTWSDRFRVIRFDLPGYGRTPVIEGPAGPVERPAAEVAELLDALGVTSAGLVGASFGGRVALELTVGRPDLVGRLLLVDSGLPGWDWSEGVRSGWAKEDAAIERDDLDAAVEANIETWVAGPTRAVSDVDPAVVDLVRVMQRRALELQVPFGEDVDDQPLAEDFQDRLGELRLPVLAVTGALDQPDFADVAARITSIVPGARHTVVDGAAHLPNLEQPAAFDAAALPFLEQG